MAGENLLLACFDRTALLKLNFDFVLTEHIKAIPVILTLLLVDLFDNLGTLIGVTRRAGIMDEKGNVPKLGNALLADSTAAILSSLLGTSTVVSYIESAAGVQAGGRTGLTAIPWRCVSWWLSL